MEINNSEDKMIWSSEELRWGSSSSPVKAYTCSFCKKGFSNAQALGGHMNIHRKDRAKLREAFDDENLLSLDITKSINPPDHRNVSLLESSDEEERIINYGIPKTAYTSSKEDDATSTPVNKDANLGTCPDKEEDKKMQLGCGSITQIEVLDLELRLGPEPHETSSTTATKNTREFF